MSKNPLNALCVAHAKPLISWLLADAPISQKPTLIIQSPNMIGIEYRASIGDDDEQLSTTDWYSIVDHSDCVQCKSADIHAFPWLAKELLDVVLGAEVAA